MRTGSEYREALHDGRRVWVMGEGLIEDVTLHPATRPMVEEYVAWYDRHHDPEWRDVLALVEEQQRDRGQAGSERSRLRAVIYPCSSIQVLA